MEKEVRDKYEAVIGLEVHAQMLTKTKAYSNDVNEYGAQVNTNISAITLGHPGTLPKMNSKTIDFAIRLGIACGCTIARKQHFARKIIFTQIYQKAIKLPKIPHQFVPVEVL